MSFRRAFSGQLSAVSFLLVALLTLPGCGYGEVSPTTYQYAKALYALSNKQAADRLDEVEAKIDAAAESGELPPREAGWLRDILAQGRAGNWKAAQSAARQIMQDQVK